jgi:hypothetical protein
MQQIVSAVSQAVIASMGGANTTALPSSAYAVETREVALVESCSASSADAAMQGPVASALQNLSG